LLAFLLVSKSALDAGSDDMVWKRLCDEYFGPVLIKASIADWPWKVKFAYMHLLRQKEELLKKRTLLNHLRLMANMRIRSHRDTVEEAMNDLQHIQQISKQLQQLKDAQCRKKYAASIVRIVIC